MNNTITLLPIMLVVTVLYALVWHDQPTGNAEKHSPTQNQTPLKRSRKLLKL